MKFCIGIVSYLPEDSENRKLRINRLERLLSQIDNFWPNTDVLIVAQNWKSFEPITKSNPIIKVSFEKGIGIMTARNTLRDTFLKSDYDYIIMFDDDAIISGSQSDATALVSEMEKNPDGFAFVKGSTNMYCPYADSQLNLAVISKKIFAETSFPKVDPQKEEAYEDRIFSTLLHNKYPNNEFDIPSNLKCIHFLNPNEPAKSTWVTDKPYNYLFMHWVTTLIEEEIYFTKKLPDLNKYINLKKEDYENSYNFKNLHFMQLWGDCSNLGYLGRTRIHGPVDNVYSVKPENIELLLDNKYYKHIVNYKFKTTERLPNFEGDSTTEYDFDTVKILHNNPTTEKYIKELKKRIDYFNEFYSKLKNNNNYYFTINFNDEVVFQTDNTLKGNVLERIIKILLKYNILHKTIFVGLNKGNTCWAPNMHLENINDYILKYKIKYVEIYENDIWNTITSEEQFKKQVIRGLKYCSWVIDRNRLVSENNIDIQNKDKNKKENNIIQETVEDSALPTLDESLFW